MATKYQTTIPVPLAVQPEMKGYVLVKVLVDDSGHALACPIESKDVKPKINAAQARARLHCDRYFRQDDHTEHMYNARFSPVPPHRCGLEYHDSTAQQILPRYLNRDLVRSMASQQNPNDRPMAMIYWYIYRLDAAGLAFERVAAQYP